MHDRKNDISVQIKLPNTFYNIIYTCIKSFAMIFRYGSCFNQCFTPTFANQGLDPKSLITPSECSLFHRRNLFDEWDSFTVLSSSLVEGNPSSSSATAQLLLQKSPSGLRFTQLRLLLLMRIAQLQNIC
jgi:hypothetical protein